MDLRRHGASLLALCATGTPVPRRADTSLPSNVGDGRRAYARGPEDVGCRAYVLLLLCPNCFLFVPPSSERLPRAQALPLSLS